ncbi:MAG: type II secretion system GspH family protein [Planctomycetaceae bacterium]|nr:type II secretion system GspH family protein [Planctomycetaceae bacterium]
MERRKMKKKGFTLVELLVVIAIIAMLLAILMPALGKVRQLAQRIMCATNLSGLGKAMLTYSNDDKYESFPIGGSSGAYWDRGTGGSAGTDSWDWRISTFVEGSGTPATPKRATISSCLYLLVKIADTTPDQFICPGSDNKKFELGNFTLATGYANASFTDVWDFGAKKDAKSGFTMGKGHNTYSYQLPLPMSSTLTTVYPITTTSNPARPVMADRNPFWISGNTTGYMYTWDSSSSKPYQASIPAGNNTYHQKDGQNVLYADLHSKFEKQANVGIQQDNIYTYWGTNTVDSSKEEVRQCGKGAVKGQETSATSFETNFTTLQTVGISTTTIPTAEDDSYLVSDIDNY